AVRDQPRGAFRADHGAARVPEAGRGRGARGDGVVDAGVLDWRIGLFWRGAGKQVQQKQQLLYFQAGQHLVLSRPCSQTQRHQGCCQCGASRRGCHQPHSLPGHQQHSEGSRERHTIRRGCWRTDQCLRGAVPGGRGRVGPILLAQPGRANSPVCSQ
ncbi:hypothetical protein EV174_007187, partial [Coemansia sp. RSA 2320]